MIHQLLCSCQPNNGTLLLVVCTFYHHHTSSRSTPHNQNFPTNNITSPTPPTHHQPAKFPTTILWQVICIAWCIATIAVCAVNSPKWYVVRHCLYSTHPNPTHVIYRESTGPNKASSFRKFPQVFKLGFKKLSEKIMRELSRHRFFNSYVAFWYISRRKGACFY